MNADLKRLQGSWQIVSLEVDGRNMSPGEASITIKGMRFTSLAMGAKYWGTLEVDETASPKGFDLVFEAGPEAGNTSFGIYELDGDRWKICLTLRGGIRPKSFATRPGSGLALETLQRASAGTAKSKPAAAEPAGDTAPELAGEWSMVSAVMSGEPLPDTYVKVGRRSATERELHVSIGGRTVLKASYAVDRSTAPKQMNYRLADGRLQAGIWELDGRQLKTCFASPGAPRATEFASVAGDGLTFSVWMRAPK